MTDSETEKNDEELKNLRRMKEEIIFESINFNSEILCLDSQLTKEIEKYIEYKRKHRWYHCILHFFGLGKSYMRNEIIMDFSDKKIQTDNAIVRADVVA